MTSKSDQLLREAQDFVKDRDRLVGELVRHSWAWWTYHFADGIIALSNCPAPAGPSPPANEVSRASLASAASGMLETLEKAAAQFRFYEHEHQQKAAASIWNGMTSAAAASSNKAATNREFAEMCEAAIAAYRAALSKES